MNAIIRRSIPAALTATLVVGAAVTIPAVAATDDTASEVPTEEPAEGLGGHRLGHRLAHGLEQGEFAERLADELGLGTEEVQDALDAVKGDLLDERLATAVDDGRLTPEQANALAAAIADGDREAAGEVLSEVRLAHLEERLAEKVEAGELTREEADELLERAEERGLPGLRGRRGDGPAGLHGVGGLRGPDAPLGDASTTDL